MKDEGTKVMLTVLELNEADDLRAWLPSEDARLEEEFEQLFGREPEEYDRKLGLKKAVEFQRLLMGLHHREDA